MNVLFLEMLELQLIFCSRLKKVWVCFITPPKINSPTEIIISIGNPIHSGGHPCSWEQKTPHVSLLIKASVTSCNRAKREQSRKNPLFIKIGPENKNPTRNAILQHGSLKQQVFCFIFGFTFDVF